MAQDVRPPQMFRDVFLHAYETGRYRGDGEEWGIVGDEKIDGVLESGVHTAVLRSEAFCRSFFPEPIVAGVVNNRDARERWEAHHEALRAHRDPLRYCWEFLERRGRLAIARRNQNPDNIARRER